MQTFLLRELLQSHYIGSEIDIAVEVLSKSRTINFTPCKIYETKGSGSRYFEVTVESIAGAALQVYFKDNIGYDIDYKRQQSLSDDNLLQVASVASSGSSSDGVVFSKIFAFKKHLKIGTGVVELEDSAFAPLEQQGKLFATACNLILGQLQYGIEWNKCCVSLMSTNGQLYQFGFVTLLYPSFPVLHLTSYVMDSANPDQLSLLAVHLHRFKDACRKLDMRIRECEIPKVVKDICICIDTKTYFSKPVKDIFSRCSTKLHSLFKIYEIFQKLHDNDVQVFFY
jgi:hypothetical protein